MTFESHLAKGVPVNSLRKWEEVGRQVAALCPNECFLALSGELGTGKTTFLKGLAKAWGISDVTSPTFTLLNVYRGKRTLLHVDAYRLSNSTALSLDFEDLCRPPFCLAVEWPEHFPKIPYDLHLQFSILRPGQHRIQRRSTPPSPQTTTVSSNFVRPH
jgi:tRNA threonylcarbamoyladenosine biosynthesis protein TsaE